MGKWFAYFHKLITTHTYVGYYILNQKAYLLQEVAWGVSLEHICALLRTATRAPSTSSLFLNIICGMRHLRMSYHFINKWNWVFENYLRGLLLKYWFSIVVQSVIERYYELLSLLMLHGHLSARAPRVRRSLHLIALILKNNSLSI
jgi:hypothetical protein